MLKTLAIPITILVLVIIVVSYTLNLNLQQMTGTAQILTGIAQVTVAVVLVIMSSAGASSFLLIQRETDDEINDIQTGTKTYLRQALKADVYMIIE
jgi:hypothetical protein